MSTERAEKLCFRVGGALCRMHVKGLTLNDRARQKLIETLEQAKKELNDVR